LYGRASASALITINYKRMDEAQRNPTVAKLTAILSIVLWLAVGIGGRGIGFL